MSVFLPLSIDIASRTSSVNIFRGLSRVLEEKKEVGTPPTLDGSIRGTPRGCEPEKPVTGDAEGEKKGCHAARSSSVQLVVFD